MGGAGDEEAAGLARRFAELRGTTKAAFAKRHGVPGGPSMLSQHLSGHRPLSLEAGVAYARGFDVPLDQISQRLAQQVREAAALLDGAGAAPEPGAKLPDDPQAVYLAELAAGLPPDLRAKLIAVAELLASPQGPWLTFSFSVTGPASAPASARGAPPTSAQAASR